MTETARDSIARLKGIPTKSELEALMEEQTVLVTFEKLDGDVRTMPLTKKLNDIPVEHHPKNKNVPHETNITGWCESANGWRSFRYDRLKKVETSMDEVLDYLLRDILTRETINEIDAALIEQIKIGYDKKNDQ